MDEEEALARWLEGDAEAFERLYALVSPRLRAYCRLLSQEEGEAADLFQETWRKALSRIHQYQRSNSFRAWLSAIARNLWVDRSRRLELETSTLKGMTPEAEAPGAPETLELRDLLGRLPPEDREVFLLYHVQGISLKEAAKSLGVTTWELRSRLARALSALQRIP